VRPTSQTAADINRTSEELQAPQKLKLPHLPVLDGIRAIAVMIVFFSHTGLDLRIPGQLGVTIFFFLSGFLITSLLRAEAWNKGTISLRNFYTRRVLRIFPPMYITLTLVLIMVLTGVLHARMTWQGVALQYVHLANYAPDLGAPLGVPAMALWSLAVEEHFYLLFPLTYLLFVGRRHGAKVALAFFGVCLAVLLVRIVNMAVISDIHSNYTWTHTRIDSILFGCCLAVWQNPMLDSPREVYRFKPWHFALAVLLIAATLVIPGQFSREVLRYSVQGLALFVMFSFVLQAKGGWIERILTTRPMQVVGVYSYTLYLVHVVFLTLIVQRVPHPSWFLRTSLTFVPTLAYCALMHRFVEKPAARLRARLHAKALAAS
jgi:peptidoglycan/LPS O-acetylase OafA/YrhL